MTLRGLWVCILAAVLSLALTSSAAPHAMTSCEPAAAHTDTSHAGHSNHDSDRQHGLLSQCCQAACAFCVAILPPSLPVLEHGAPSVTAALVPTPDGVSVPPILAPPKRIL
jgi:hypothetical protein